MVGCLAGFPSFLLFLYLPYSPQTLRSFPVPVRTTVRTCYIRPCRILASSSSGLLGRRVLWSRLLPLCPVTSPWEKDPQNCHAGDGTDRDSRFLLLA